jgi:hypothetical protein
MAPERSSRGVRRRRVLPACLALFAAAAGLAWAAQQIVVKVSELQIQGSVTGFARPVALVKKGQTLQVISRQGDWLRVRTPGGQEGFVKEAAVTERSLAPSTTFNLPGDARSSGPEASAATKGLEPQAVEFANVKGYRTDRVEGMIQTYQLITPEEFERFLAEGGLSPGR